MKLNSLTTKIVFFLLLLLVHPFLYAQTNTRITIKSNNITLSKALEQIERQSKMSIAYNQSKLDVRKTLSLNIVDKSLSDALDIILKGSGFIHKVDGQYIALVPEVSKEPATKGKTNKRTGKVTDLNGNPIPFANVVIKGTGVGVTTNANGGFSIDAPEGSVLSISFIGYTPATVTVDDELEYQVALKEDAQKLDQVVIIGYNTVKKRQATGALEVVKSDEIQFQSSPTLESRIQGKSAGVLISRGSGQPGSNNLNILIRGTGSINGSNTPLYIMDGVMVEPAQFASLSSNDIADIQILKDASAIAIYGSRGANGVVVISTKGGSAGKTKFNYRNQIGISYMPNYIDMMNSAQNLQYQLQCVQSDPSRSDYPLMQILKRETDGTASQADLDRLAKARSVNTDWIDEMTRRGMLMEHSLSATGGTDKTKFYLSGSYLDQDGVLKKANIKRYSGRFNIDHTANQWVSLGLKMTAGYSKMGFSDPKGANSRNGWFNPWFTALLAYPYESPEGWYNKDNPTLITKYYDQEQNNLKAVWSTYLKGNITDWLSVKTNFGMDYMNNRSQDVLHRNHPNSQGNKGYFAQGYSEIARYTWTNTANINKVFENGHALNAVFGAEMFKGQYYGANFKGYDINPFMMESPAGIGDKIGASKNPPSVGGGSTMSDLLSYFSQANYSINVKYNLSASLRYDESSKFLGSNKSAMFWSVGGSWNLNAESFLKDVEWLNQLKVRASYGTTGNQDGISDFGTYDGYSNTSYNGNAGYVHFQQGNPSLKWETSKQADIGVDFTAFSGRLNATVDVYYKKTTDLYMNKMISLTSGFGSITTNAGSVSNKGVEVSIDGAIIRGKDLSWNVGANFTYNRNEMLDLGVWSNSENKFQNGDAIYQVGKPIGTWSMVEWAGVNPDNGLVMFYDKNGNKTENIADAPKVDKFGSSQIPIFGGFNTSLSYKELTLTADFTYAFNYHVMNAMRWYVYNHHFNGNKVVDMLNMWMKPGDITDIPRFGAGSQPSPWASQFLEDASYVRFKSLRVNYMLPQNIVKKTKFFENISVYAQVENLYTWTKYKGADPEVNGAYDIMSYPKPIDVTFGLDINF